MKMSAVKEAIVEAERFLKRAKKLRPYVKDDYPQESSYAAEGAESASCKRASMDLTRSLAKMRQS